MNYQAVSELITSSNHNVLIVGGSASEVDSFLNKLNITDYKYYDFSQIYSCSDRTLVSVNRPPYVAIRQELVI
ncbi:hypothetical protein AW115_29495 [Escherichia coli]|nr:hypothetical protein AW066_29375 [Escherichia coli]OTE37860.1 hypothetical protein AW115_29495 [Escherichia coli]TJQ00040.1 hypothetical protein C9Z71_26270 [Escherichia coli]